MHKRLFIYRYIKFILLFVFLPFIGCTPETAPEVKSEKGLKDYYADNFLIGVALHPGLINDPVASELITLNFNSITPENHMKWALIHPEPENYNFVHADEIAEFAQKNKMKLIGHTLVWHSQLGRGVFTKKGDDGTDVPVDAETLLERIREHIFSVAGKYRGRVHGWDVVNEALNEDGTLRKSGFLDIIGESYIEKAFQYAHEADPEAELYYNDFNLVKPAKRHGAVELIRRLKEKGIKIDAVGVQAHWDLKFPDLEEIENTITEFSELGIKVMFTELDISVLPDPREFHSDQAGVFYQNDRRLDPYVNGLTESAEEELAERYSAIFSIFNKYRDNITRVTFWGLHDGMSWKNNYPVFRRTDYPLLFDRDFKPKKAYHEVIRLVEQEG